MESNIKGLVAAWHEMASELKAECGAVDMRSVAKLISDLATQLEVQLVRANAMAAENELERNQQYIKRRDQKNEDIALTVGKLRVELEEVKQHAEELSETKAVRNQWRPDICPITGRAFFMWIEHPTLGNVPTYGGPLDSYTIPTKDGDGEFSCERYDHDFGGWVESECLGLYLIDDREQCRVYELEERVKELDAREISLPERSSMLHRTDFHDDYQTVMAYKVSEVIDAIRATGIRIKGE